MNKTLPVSFSLRNTYRVNSILYSIKQIPLLKRILPDTLYRVTGLKVFANVLSVIWEVVSAFLWKAVYIWGMIAGIGTLYDAAETSSLHLHMLLFLTIAGAFFNTYLFNPTRDKYYAIILLRMNAREYALIHYGYALLKAIAGFMPFVILLGMQTGIPLWVCILLPFSIVGAKLAVASWSLWDYERTGRAANENKLGKWTWIVAFLLLAAAYGLPAFGFVLPLGVSVGILLLFLPAGIFAAWRVYRFSYYRELYQQLLFQSMHQMDATQLARKQTEKIISTDTAIASRRKGFEYLNELFVKRHQKILWRASKRIAGVCACLLLGAFLLFYLMPETKERVNEILLSFLPYFAFIMYAINRGTGFTRALFVNCDHSLLTYSFYKQPKMVLKLFRIRLREIVKINLLPAAVIGGGAAALLYVSGGTEEPLHYAVLIVSILCMSVFFSVHYLTIYYLLQPYNAGTEMKSGTYQLVLSATYLVCFFLMQLRMPILLFGVLCIAFCVIYCIAACILVYRFAPQTFRLRS